MFAGFICVENAENKENAENPIYLHGKCRKYGKSNLSMRKMRKISKQTFLFPVFSALSAVGVFSAFFCTIRVLSIFLHLMWQCLSKELKKKEVLIMPCMVHVWSCMVNVFYTKMEIWIQ